MSWTDPIVGLEKAWFSARYLGVHGLLSDGEKAKVYKRIRKEADRLGLEAFANGGDPLDVRFRKKSK